MASHVLHPSSPERPHSEMMESYSHSNLEVADGSQQQFPSQHDKVLAYQQAGVTYSPSADPSPPSAAATGSRRGWVVPSIIAAVVTAIVVGAGVGGGLGSSLSSCQTSLKYDTRSFTVL